MAKKQPAKKKRLQKGIFGLFFAALAAILSYLIWRFGKYWLQLLGRPPLPPIVVPPGVAAETSLETRALLIASTNLLGGLERRGLDNGHEKTVLCAGIRNFREPWARDFGFASYGLMELEEFQAAKETLEVFLLNQRRSGQFPVKVHSTSVLDRYLHSLFSKEQPIHRPIKPKHITAHKTISLDGNALLVIAALHYADRSGDDEFIKEHWSAIKQAIKWLDSHASPIDGLLVQEKYADWADSVARGGKVLYPNVLYWKASFDMARAATKYGFDFDELHFTTKADHLEHAICNHFWREDLGYFVTSQELSQLSSDGNLLAVAWNLATPQQANSILDKMRDLGMDSPVPTKVAQPAYPNNLIAIENRLAGIGNYHTTGAWLWLGAWHIIALLQAGRHTEAETLLKRVSNAIVRDGAVHEVYASDGHHLSTFFYTSEAPLTWSAGMVVYAYHQYQRIRGQGSEIRNQP